MKYENMKIIIEYEIFYICIFILNNHIQIELVNILR